MKIKDDKFAIVERNMDPDEKQRIAQSCFSYEDYQHKITQRWFNHMNQNNFFQSLLDTIKNKKWIALTKKEQKNFSQNDSDLLDKWEVKSPKELHKIQLSIPAEHINQLKTFNDQILETYNLFDIWLKDKYQTNIVDFIDYQNGEVFLIKPVKYNF